MSRPLVLALARHFSAASSSASSQRLVQKPIKDTASKINNIIHKNTAHSTTTPESSPHSASPPKARLSKSFDASTLKDLDMMIHNPKITVIGVGGGGGNALNNMVHANLQGVRFVAANTDVQALANSMAEIKVQLGRTGLGAGADPQVARQAAEEDLDEIMHHIQDSNMVFITCGMGGGTGTGAAPVIAKACREAGLLTVGVVTTPFKHEGTRRMRLAEAGIAQLEECVDTMITIPNANLFKMADSNTSLYDAFRLADNVLLTGVRAVTDLVQRDGLINLDFADVASVMRNGGDAMMGAGVAEGPARASEAADQCLKNPLLGDIDFHGATGVLVNIAGGQDVTLFETEEISDRICSTVSDDANIIFGCSRDASLEGKIRVSVIMTGLQNKPGSTTPTKFQQSQTPPSSATETHETQTKSKGTSGWFS